MSRFVSGIRPRRCGIWCCRSDPPATEHLTEDELAELVTRDSMIGTAKVTLAGEPRMNGVHDMGGMHGMGPIAPEPNEPVFHERLGSPHFRAQSSPRRLVGKWNIDAGRHARERIPPAEYLRMSYYEKWLAGLVDAAGRNRPRHPRRARKRPAGAGVRQGGPAADRRSGRGDGRRADGRSSAR